MTVPDDAEGDLRGVPMDDDEVNEFLRNHGQGILSLADSDDAYAVPVSFGYDDNALYFVLHKFGDNSEKLDFVTATNRAAFTAYQFDNETRWRSVLVCGQLEKVREENQDRADEILFENAQFVSLFPHGEPVTDQPRFRLRPNVVTGQQGTGYVE
jgi:nitroimidazol reductase NimA-like FMN-containing flavoprotein (pyridoxamine 5'-phosphate oxidase superfamily)